MKLKPVLVAVAICAAGAALTLAQGPGMGRGHGMMMGRPLPSAIPSASNPMTPAKIDLGRMLYYEPRLSRNNHVSCNSCHDLESYGVDGKAVSTGHLNQQGSRNAPTVYHAAGHLAQFWDGRALDVEEQAKGPVLNPIEMALSSGEEVEDRLRQITGYVAAFRRAFPDEAQPVTFDNMARAIGAFERGLVTPSRWDRFLAGDRQALNTEEMQGHHEFMHRGCAACHSGTYIGGGLFHRLGAEKPWPETSDLGRFEITKTPTDRMVFKVPSLRNVEKTAPYFHNGKVASLDEAVHLMGEYQLGEDLTAREVQAIVSWLRTLTGEIPREYVRRPSLPE
jgi:cytochrome c peroxidase